MDRRELLSAVSAGALALLAGCADGDADDSTTPAPDTTDPADAEGTSGTGGPTTAGPPEVGTGPTTATTTGTSSTTPTGTSSSTPTGTPSSTPTGTATAAVTVEVAPDGQLRFDPETAEIQVGESVRWIWRGDGHNVTPGTIPDGATWDGSEGSPGETHDAGHEYVHAFETAGTYEYYCDPHRSLDMTGAVEVV